VYLKDNNMDYIPEPSEFHVADHELPFSPITHVESIDSQVILHLSLLSHPVGHRLLGDQRENAPWWI